MSIKRGIFLVIFIFGIISQIVIADCICGSDPGGDCNPPTCTNADLSQSPSAKEAADYCNKNGCTDKQVSDIPDSQKDDFFKDADFDKLNPNTVKDNMGHINTNNRKFTDWFKKQSPEEKRDLRNNLYKLKGEKNKEFWDALHSPESEKEFWDNYKFPDITNMFKNMGWDGFKGAFQSWWDRQFAKGLGEAPTDVLTDAFQSVGLDLGFDYPPGTDISLDENGNLIVNGNEINLESLIGNKHTIKVDSKGNVYLDGKLLVKNSVINVDSSGPDDIFNLGSGSYELDDMIVNALNNFNVQLNGFATGESAESISIKKRANFSTQLLSLDVINPKGIMLNFSI